MRPLPSAFGDQRRPAASRAALCSCHLARTRGSSALTNSKYSHGLGQPGPGRRVRAQQADALPQDRRPPGHQPVPAADDLVPDVVGHPVVVPPRAGLALPADHADAHQVAHAAGHSGRAGLQLVGRVRRRSSRPESVASSAAKTRAGIRGMPGLDQDRRESLDELGLDGRLAPAAGASAGRAAPARSASGTRCRRLPAGCAGLRSHAAGLPAVQAPPAVRGPVRAPVRTAPPRWQRAAGVARRALRAPGQRLAASECFM